jgi:hypothetical protein
MIKGLAYLVVAFSLSLPAVYGQDCAPVLGYASPPSSGVDSVCFYADGIPGWVIHGGITKWTSNCSSFGSGAPNLVGPGETCSGVSIPVTVSYSSEKHPENFDATTRINAIDGFIVSAEITCYVNYCSDHLLAHEMGHALGLGDTSDPACDKHVMHNNPSGPREYFAEACSKIDSCWTGPSDTDGGGGDSENSDMDGLVDSDGGGGSGGSTTPSGTVSTTCCILNECYSC